MNVSLYQAAAALSASSQWEDVVSENLTASSVPGFRKQALRTEAVQAGLIPGTSGSPEYFSLPKSTPTTSFMHAELNYTGNDKNVAIDGDGFFSAQLPDGTPLVTRDGQFKLTTKGDLVTKEGYTVMGDRGPIKLDPHSHAELKISPKGDITQGGAVKARLKVVDYENPQLLTQTNGVYFMATDEKLVDKPVESNLKQGFVEGSNASALSEMANMMTAMRTFEANQHVVQVQDDRMSKTITELGNPSS